MGVVVYANWTVMLAKGNRKSSCVKEKIGGYEITYAHRVQLRGPTMACVETTGAMNPVQSWGNIAGIKVWFRRRSTEMGYISCPHLGRVKHPLTPPTMCQYLKPGPLIFAQIKFKGLV